MYAKPHRRAQDAREIRVYNAQRKQREQARRNARHGPSGRYGVRMSMQPATAQLQGRDECGAVFDRGPRERPRRVYCKNPKGHDGQHFAVWGGSQKWRQMNWSDEPKPGAPQPLYIVVRVDDEIEDVQSMLALLTEFGEQVTLNVGPFRFTQAEIVRKGTVAP